MVAGTNNSNNKNSNTSNAAADQKTPLLGSGGGGGGNQHYSTTPRPPVSRPKYKRRRSSFDASTYNSAGQSPGYVRSSAASSIHEPLTLSDPGLDLRRLLGLTICMAGVQFTWTVELSYGTPYLLSLNLSKELTALVWIAGPLSGLLVQPLIGAFSDKCTSRFGKRRPFIVIAGLLTCFSMIGVAYAREIAHVIVRLQYGDDEQDLDIVGQASRTYAIVVAVAAFYFLDFTLNAVQAICRALILDIPPLWQQDEANAWSARMCNSSMVIGYFVGFVDLVKLLPWLGDSQIKVFCAVAIVVFCATLGITCVTTHEKKLDRADDEDNQPWYSTFVYIWRAFRWLPRPVQTLCNTQFFAWMGWFPFLFYSTQWVSDIYFSTHPSNKGTDDNWADGTRAGSFALLCYSIVSVIAGVVIPAFVSRYEKAIRWFSLTNVYTASHLVVAGALLSAWFVDSVAGATVVLAVMGIPWAIVLWVPFSLVGEFVSYEDEQRQKAQFVDGVTASLTGSSSSSSPARMEDQQEDFDAGMILGVHNMYIVFPQFAVAIIAAFIFAAADALDPENGGKQDSSSVAPVLAFGGMMALIAAAFSRFVVRVK
ncbi:major facilitator superfamily domain-containing protein [Zychaea mexicana]|uniref:major facilitator superfamily domain-containing protein n=1 Tax=Zychaea mexicana TaxID=64656 RepID=UPI0022FF2F5A|nr:major facilitator superfamily domain-containing protein [Zychaea mexicana]KAI9474856.1 major facilitator superfamily domain-containing protein [Zychaea mexicana]